MANKDNAEAAQSGVDQLQALLEQIQKQNPPQAQMPQTVPIIGQPGSTDAASGGAANPAPNGTAPAQKSIAPATGGVNGVTNAIMNQGQLITTPGSAGASASSPDESSHIKNLEAMVNKLMATSGTNNGDMGDDSQKKDSGGGGLGGIVGDAVGAVTSAIGWIICTELVKQGRMPYRYYIAGAKVFAAYPENGKHGYYIWAIPCVHHLRARPFSLLSRFLSLIFNWRAENIAYHAGVRGAKKNWKGAAVTAVLYPICYVVGNILVICGHKCDWASVYKEQN